MSSATPGQKATGTIQIQILGGVFRLDMRQRIILHERQGELYTIRLTAKEFRIFFPLVIMRECTYPLLYTLVQNPDMVMLFEKDWKDLLDQRQWPPVLCERVAKMSQFLEEVKKVGKWEREIRSIRDGVITLNHKILEPFHLQVIALHGYGYQLVSPSSADSQSPPSIGTLMEEKL